MSMRVMGGRDIIIAAALFAFYHEVSHLLVFNSFQNAGFAFATQVSHVPVAFNNGTDVAGGLSYLIGRL